jgi:hypothetical protein
MTNAIPFNYKKYQQGWLAEYYYRGRWLPVLSCFEIQKSSTVDYFTMINTVKNKREILHKDLLRMVCEKDGDQL